MCYSRPMVYAYVPNFVSIGLFCHPLLAKNPIFAFFWTSAFSGVANWQQIEKVRDGCTTTNFPLSNGIEIFSVLQRLHGEMAKLGAQSLTFKSVTDKQTNKQTKKLNVFGHPGGGEKSEPNQTWHGNRGPRARSFTSKTFGGLTHRGR